MTLMGPIIRGDNYTDDRRIELSLVDENNDPYDLTDHELTFGVYASRRATVAEFTKTGADVEIPTQTGDDLGKAYVSIEGSDTEAMSLDRFWVWELEGSGGVTLDSGRFVLVGTPTNEGS